MKLWKMKKSSYFDHEIMYLVEKNVGTPAILDRTPDTSREVLYSTLHRPDLTSL
jgi:hypothetical protein